MTLDVIIPTYDRYERLYALLDSLQPQAAVAGAVYVVDHSPDRAQHARELARRFPFCTVVPFDGAGLPATRNRGIRRSRGDIVLFLDDDVVVHRGCLQAHIHAHARDGAIGVVAGRVCQQGENAWAPIEVPAEVDPQSGVTRGNFDLAVPGDALYATGCNMSLKRAVFFRAGMFDPRFRGSGLFEEVDMCYRVRRAGYRIRFCPEAALTHTPHARGGGRTGPPLVRLYDRLHNHSVFYFRHIRRLPSPAFVKEVRNLAEYISRKPDTGHSAARLCRCALEVVTGYIHAYIPWWFPRP